jgi:membrane protein involved in colicin uptake
METTETRFPIFLTDEQFEGENGTLSVKVTSEGVIFDVENYDGEVIATNAMMAQDIADEWCY